MVKEPVGDTPNVWLWARGQRMEGKEIMEKQGKKRKKIQKNVGKILENSGKLGNYFLLIFLKIWLENYPGMCFEVGERIL